MPLGTWEWLVHLSLSIDLQITLAIIFNSSVAFRCAPSRMRTTTLLYFLTQSILIVPSILKIVLWCSVLVWHFVTLLTSKYRCSQEKAHTFQILFHLSLWLKKVFKGKMSERTWCWRVLIKNRQEGTWVQDFCSERDKLSRAKTRNRHKLSFKNRNKILLLLREMLLCPFFLFSSGLL